MSDISRAEEWYLAFDIGGTKIASGLVTFPSEGDAVCESVRSVPTRAMDGGDSVMERLAACARVMLDMARAQGRKILGIGVGSAGVVDSDNGIIVSATSLMPGWAGQEIGHVLGEACRMPVHVVGDVGAHGLGEALYGAGKPYASILSVGVGTGIGGAYVDHGVLMSGAHGVAGHVGHMPHPLGRGVLCSCGTTSGHIEPVASGTGLAALYNLRRLANIAPVADGREVVCRAAEGERLAIDVLRDSARALGECLAGLGNLFDPEAIVLSGSVVGAGRLWWGALQEGFQDGALLLVRQTPLIQGALGDAAPLIGAAAACRASMSRE